MMLAIVRALLRFERRRLERFTFGPYNPMKSRRLDAVIVAIEALSS